MGLTIYIYIYIYIICIHTIYNTQLQIYNKINKSYHINIHLIAIEVCKILLNCITFNMNYF